MATELAKSSIKLDELGFNNCPSRDEFVQELKKLKVQYEAVDVVDGDYQQNTEDTVMVAIKVYRMQSILNFTTIVHRYSPDEYGWFLHEDSVVFRLWWD